MDAVGCPSDLSVIVSKRGDYRQRMAFTEETFELRHNAIMFFWWQVQYKKPPKQSLPIPPDCHDLIQESG
jgi:hypothetical protein